MARKVSTSFLLSLTVNIFYIFHFSLVRLVTTPPVGVWSMGYGCAPQPSQPATDPSPVLLCRHQPALAPSRCVVLADNGGAGSGLWRMRGKQAKNLSLRSICLPPRDSFYIGGAPTQTPAATQASAAIESARFSPFR